MDWNTIMSNVATSITALIYTALTTFFYFLGQNWLALIVVTFTIIIIVGLWHKIRQGMKKLFRG